MPRNPKKRAPKCDSSINKLNSKQAVDEESSAANSMDVVSIDKKAPENIINNVNKNEKKLALRVLSPISNINIGIQTSDLTIGVDSIFQFEFPKGDIQFYSETDKRSRISRDEARLSALHIAEIETSLRKAGEVHKEVRSYIQTKICPGVKLWDICNDLEDKVRSIIGENGPLAGMGFPTGCSLNNVAAHYTPNPGDSTVLQYCDVMKFDFGTEINGYIIDSAFTVAFDPQYDNLLLASQDATFSGLRMAGIDARLGEIGGVIEEVINSYEVTINGRTYPVIPMRNLSGHNIVKGCIHGDKCIPLVAEDSSEIMEEGDIFALETFASTGKGIANPGLITSHYALNKDDAYPPMLQSEEILLKHIMKTFDTLPFCRRWLDRCDGGSFAMNGSNGRQAKCIDALNGLVKKGIVEDYPPLCDVIGSFSSQWEHTFLIKDNCKEIFSKGNDY